MGMFDELMIDKVHLPKGFKDKETGWQTKSLDNCLFLKIIDKDGQLYETESEWISASPSDPVILFHTGEIIFYRYEEHEYIEFSANFKDGKMLDLKQNFEPFWRRRILKE